MSERIGTSRSRYDQDRRKSVQDDPSGCADDKQADFVDFSRYLAHIIPLAGSSAVYLLVFMCMKTRSRGRSPYTELCQKLLMQESLQHNFQPSSVHG